MLEALKKLWYFIYQYMGIGFIVWMIHPPIDTTNKRKPSNFLLWVVGLHVGLMGIAYQRYENAVNRWHNNYNVLIERLGDEYNSAILQLINDKKNELIPVEPSLLDITSVYRNFNEDWNEPYYGTQNEVEKLLSLYIPSHPGEYSNLSMNYDDLIFDRTGDYSLRNSTIKKITIQKNAKLNISESEIDELNILNRGSNLNLELSSVGQLKIKNSYLELSMDSVIGTNKDLTIQNSMLRDSNLELDTAASLRIYNSLFVNTLFELKNIKNIEIEETIFYKCVFMNKDVYEHFNKKGSYFYDCLVFESKPTRYSSQINVSELEANINLKDFITYFDSWELIKMENSDSAAVIYQKKISL